MKVKIVTAIFNGLYGTELGGRPGRNNHYRYSLKSLMKMTDADFVCYTSPDEIDDLSVFFKTQIDNHQLTLKPYDLRNFKYSDRINKIKDVESTKTSDRCIEIQYSKFIWLSNEIEDLTHDYVFWFDGGLSHNGLIPNKYLNKVADNFYEQHYDSILFNNKFLQNLINHCGEKIQIVAKNNVQHFWSQTVPQKYYSDYCMELHIIGGFFGGKIEKMRKFCVLFFSYLELLLDNEDRLYAEENIMTLTYYIVNKCLTHFILIYGGTRMRK